MGQSEDSPNHPRHVTDSTLDSDFEARMSYNLAFLKFTPEDGVEVNNAKSLLASAIPAMVDNVYKHLTSFDVTAKAFRVPQSAATESDKNVEAKTEDLTLDHPNIQLRKDFLSSYLVKLVGNHDWSPQSPFWKYLDKVGIMHTGQPGFAHRAKRPELRVEVQHCSLLLGCVLDMVLQEVMNADQLENETKMKTLKALNKLIWIQNDLFQRHYVTRQ